MNGENNNILGYLVGGAIILIAGLTLGEGEKKQYYNPGKKFSGSCPSGSDDKDCFIDEDGTYVRNTEHSSISSLRKVKRSFESLEYSMDGIINVTKSMFGIFGSGQSSTPSVISDRRSRTTILYR